MGEPCTSGGDEMGQPLHIGVGTGYRECGLLQGIAPRVWRAVGPWQVTEIILGINNQQMNVFHGR